MIDDRQLVLNLQPVGRTYSIDWVNAARKTKDWYSKYTIPPPTPDYIREVLDYNADTGDLIWKERKDDNRFNANFAGKKIELRQSDDGKSRHQINFITNGGTASKKIYYARVVWCWVHGEWPDSDLVVDHINGDSFDNRIQNLRVISRAENSKNRKVGARNTSGHMGVTWDESMKKWRAGIHSNGNKITLGFWKDKADAVQARKDAERKYGYHENHGREVS